MTEDVRRQSTISRLCESVPLLSKPIIVVLNYTDEAVKEHGTFQGRMRGLGLGLLLVAALVVTVMAVSMLWELGRHWGQARLTQPSVGGHNRAPVEATFDDESKHRWIPGRHGGAYAPTSVEAVTICDAVPFVGAGIAGFLGVTDASDGPSIIVRGLLSGFETAYFDSDLLKSGTKYRADISTPGKVWSAFTVRAGRDPLVVVSVEWPDPSHPRYGLIPWAEYAHFLQSTGR